jgi:hypothetical protein
VEIKSNRFCWMGSTRPMDEFNYFFRETPHGIVRRLAEEVVELVHRPGRAHPAEAVGLDLHFRPERIALQERCREEGVALHFGESVPPDRLKERFPDSDVIVVPCGVSRKK